MNMVFHDTIVYPAYVYTAALAKKPRSLVTQAVSLCALYQTFQALA